MLTEMYNPQERNNTGLKQSGCFQLLRALILIQYNFYHGIMLLLVTCTSAILRARFSMCTDVHLKRCYVHKISCTKNHNFYEGLLVMTFLIILSVTGINKFSDLFKMRKQVKGYTQRHLLLRNHEIKTNNQLEIP